MINDGEDKFSFNYETIMFTDVQTVAVVMKANAGSAILFEENDN